MMQTRKDQRQAPWERFATFELKLQDIETKLAVWEERIVDLEDRLIRLDEYCKELFVLEGTQASFAWRFGAFVLRVLIFVESEHEKYMCAIATSIVLMLLFVYDGIMMGLPQLNFWMYLELPHFVLAGTVVGVSWRMGLFHAYPAAYILGFTALLAMAMIHQQNFLHNQNEWRGMKILLSPTLQSQASYITIEADPDNSSSEWQKPFMQALETFWQTLRNYTNTIKTTPIRP